MNLTDKEKALLKSTVPSMITFARPVVTIWVRRDASAACVSLCVITDNVILRYQTLKCHECAASYLSGVRKP